MEVQEDLLLNDFFRCLQQKYSSLYAEAEKNCYLICVPQKKSLSGLTLTRKLFEVHILKPSMLEGVWCVFNDTQRTVTIRDNIIRTGPGYTDEGREVTILFEELFYNKQYQPFRVVCISRPLEGGSDRPSATISPSTSPPSLSSLCTFQQCCHYLHSWPENELVLKKVLERTREFNQCYEIVPGFEQCVVDKVRTMCKDAVEALLCANKTFRKAQNNPSQLRDLSLVIETFVLGHIYDKLYSGLCLAFQNEDVTLRNFVATLRPHITLQSLGTLATYLLSLTVVLERDPLYVFICASVILVCWFFVVSIVLTARLGVRSELARLDITPASTTLMKLESEKSVCPLEKYHILRATLQSLQRCVNDNEVLSSDDLLSLLTYVLVHTPLQHLHTIVFFLEHFFFAPITTTEIDYHIVTFKAAVEYLKTELQQHITRSPSNSSFQTSSPRLKQNDIPEFNTVLNRRSETSSTSKIWSLHGEVNSFEQERNDAGFFRHSTSQPLLTQTTLTKSMNSTTTTTTSFTHPLSSYTSLSPSSSSASMTQRSMSKDPSDLSSSPRPLSSVTPNSNVTPFSSPPEVISINQPIDLSHLKSLGDSSFW